MNSTNITLDEIIEGLQRFLGTRRQKAEPVPSGRRPTPTEFLQVTLINLKELRKLAETQEWRVSGNPGPEFGPYNFVWPRRGYQEDGEGQARAFYNLITDGNHIPWVDGPRLHHRTVYHHEGPWIEEAPGAN